jgi:DEAD/DEAH box helicase domain-containing protein
LSASRSRRRRRKEKATDLDALIEELESAGSYEDQIVHRHVREARPPRFGDLKQDLDPTVRQILEHLGIDRFYSHQAEAIGTVLEGENVCVVASTAGGKTLCYTIPIAQRIYERPTSRAFLVFPTKALAQDQLRKLEDFGAGIAFTAACYDGDTPQHKRRGIKRDAQVVLTNPDMLHVGILPYHHTWADFFRNLKYVVLDEVHIYRGVFGSHTANVIRRLRRVAANYGANPQFICCSATIGNPDELSRNLTGLDVRVIDDDGAPQGKRTWVFWNPPLAERGSGRRSSLIESATLLRELVDREIRAIDFTIARKTAELIVRHARRLLGGARSKDAKKVMSYRGGYLPKERREIEKRLFDGDLLGVVSTSALELGIDIGHLRAVILTGFPGTIASTFQQAGRAGRGQEDSLAILVGQDNSVDQFLMEHPDFLFRTASEKALIDPTNRFIVAAHLLCAAYELPIDQSDLALFGPQSEDILQILAEARYVTRRTRWYWIGEGYPAGQISLRSASGEGYDIVEGGPEGRLLGTMDAQSAFSMIHEGAVYMHLGETYVVKELDLEEKVAHVEQTDVDYYTDALTDSQVWIEQETEHATFGDGIPKYYGELRVVDRVTSYVKRMPGKDAPGDREELDLPAQEYETVGFWIPLAGEHVEMLNEEGRDLTGSIHAIEHAMAALTPIVAPCDARDVGGVSHPSHPDVGGPAIFIYDGFPGGVGITEVAYEQMEQLAAAARERIAACPCETGCPSCVQSPFCGDMNQPLDKQGALTLLRAWVPASASDSNGAQANAG